MMLDVSLASIFLCLVWIQSQARSLARSNEKCCVGEIRTCYVNSPAYSQLPKPRCPDATWPTFDLYTRSRNNTSDRLTQGDIPDSFNASARTIFIVHGYLSRGHVQWVTRLKNELLYKGNYNVIIVDWEKGAKSKGFRFKKGYKIAASTTRVVGRLLADTAKRLVTSGGADRKQMWCVGHSLGAHTCGEAGALFHFGRITGLDPAGPSYVYRNIGLRQDTADFVDVIHTDHTHYLGCCGHLQPRGDVDFYPNGGRTQPGCSIGKRAISRWLGCSHLRAVTYFIDSINRCRFYSNYICDDPYRIKNDWKEVCVKHRNSTLQEMGFHADNQGYMRAGLFYLTTRGRCNASISAIAYGRANSSYCIQIFTFLLISTFSLCILLFP